MIKPLNDVPANQESGEPIADQTGRADSPSAAAPVSGTTAAPPEKPASTREGESEFPFSVTVGEVYDGPLDLLLDLVRKQNIDIYDIPIAKITAQFLAYVEHLKASDVDTAGEFIYMSALLILPLWDGGDA